MIFQSEIAERELCKSTNKKYSKRVKYLLPSEAKQIKVAGKLEATRYLRTGTLNLRTSTRYLRTGTRNLRTGSCYL